MSNESRNLMDGLIDTLPHYGLDASGGVQTLDYPTQIAGGLIRRDHLLAALASEKWREALAEALWREWWVSELAGREPAHEWTGTGPQAAWLVRADVVARILTGEATSLPPAEDITRSPRKLRTSGRGGMGGRR